MRRSMRALLAVAPVGATVLLALPCADAHAASYRYWTYWQGTAGAWAFATAGPAFTLPPDGSVEGWRFAVTTQAGTASSQPGTLPAFDALCGGTAPAEGKKRIALVVDSGAQGDGPAGERAPAPVATCVVADADATGYDVLRSVAEVRTDNGLVCSIGGYPARECAPMVDDAPAATTAAAPAPQSAETAAAAPPATGTPTSSGPWMTITVAVVAIGAGTLLWKRRRG